MVYRPEQAAALEMTIAANRLDFHNRAIAIRYILLALAYLAVPGCASTGRERGVHSSP